MVSVVIVNWNSGPLLAQCLRSLAAHGGDCERIVLESGITSASDVRRIAELGVSKFLVGTSIIRSGSIALKVRELKGALGDG